MQFTASGWTEKILVTIATRQLKGGPVLFWAKGRSYSCWGDKDMTGCHESNGLFFIWQMHFCRSAHAQQNYKDEIVVQCEWLAEMMVYSCCWGEAISLVKQNFFPYGSKINDTVICKINWSDNLIYFLEESHWLIKRICFVLDNYFGCTYIIHQAQIR